MTVITFAERAVRSEASADPQPAAVAAVTGSLASPGGGAGRFMGSFRLERFLSRAGTLSASGVFTGELTDADGSRIGMGSHRRTVAVVVVPDGTGTGLAVRLGPVDVNLLGIVVNVAETSVELRAAPRQRAPQESWRPYGVNAREAGDGRAAAQSARAVIEQATGVLVGLAHCAADEACADLMSAAEENNATLHDLAVAVVALASDAAAGPSQCAALETVVRARWGDLSTD